MKILFINNKTAQCGVFQYGKNMYDGICKSKLYKIDYIEIDKFNINYDNYDVLLFNYHPATMPYLNEEIISIINKDKVTISIAHDNCLLNFKYYIVPDPTFISCNNKFKIGRLLFDYSGDYSINNVPIIGTFGLARGGKGFEKIVDRVLSEFNDFIVNIHIPESTYCPSSVVNKITNMYGNDTRINITSQYLHNSELLKFLASNDINLFMYDRHEGCGISSVIDYALSVKRPIGITNSYMFRHIIKSNILLENNTIKNIMDLGTLPLQEFYNWNEENFILEFENILRDIHVI